MPIYQVRNPMGQVIEIKGDKPPTREIVEDIFKQAFVQSAGGEEAFAKSLASGIQEATQGDLDLTNVKPESQLAREQRIQERVQRRQAPVEVAEQFRQKALSGDTEEDFVSRLLEIIHGDHLAIFPGGKERRLIDEVS